MTRVHSQTLENMLHFYPKVATIVTVHAQGKDNAMAVAWNMPISRTPPLYAVSVASRRYTYELIRQAGEFAVNFLPLEAVELVLAMGSVSGRDIDKFEQFGVAKDEAFTTAPVLQAAYAAYECRLVDTKTYGDHDIIIGEIVGVHYDDACFDEAGMLRLDRAHPTLYLGNDFFATADAASLRHLDRDTTATTYRGQRQQVS